VSFGTELPAIVTPPPGARSRALSAELAAFEAPGINTLAGSDSGESGESGEPPPPNLLWEEACGANVRDVDGNLYIDLTAGFGVAAAGHRHPRVVAAVTEQAGRLLHGLGDVYAHPLRVALARRLVELAPVDAPQVFFAISGAEAVEIALKTALAKTGRPGILAFDPAYHGLTLGALAVTSREEFRRPFSAHLHPHVHRLPFGGPPERIVEVLDRGGIGGIGGIGAALFEPVVGREGVILPPPGWLPRLAALCGERGVVTIADEIFTGLGRTGSLFAVEHEGVRPDLLCCGKALGGGLPIAAVVGRRDVMAVWATPGEARHTATFVAHPLACAAALAALDVLIEEDLPARARRLGEQLGRRLADWPGRLPGVQAVRGRGLLWGVELASRPLARRWVEAARGRGVLLLAGGPEGRVGQIVPPLSITERQLWAAVEILEAELRGAAGMTEP
jgi:4-aminobutyrate aminotransferase-like enzyme